MNGAPNNAGYDNLGRGMVEHICIKKRRAIRLLDKQLLLSHYQIYTDFLVPLGSRQDLLKLANFSIATENL